MKTSLIIVDYKTMPQTIEYVEHCCRNIREWNEVAMVIVDNDPNQETMKVFLEACRDAKRVEIKTGVMWTGTLSGRPVYYVKNVTNIGLAKAHNLAVAVASKFYEPDYLLFSNNDIRFTGEISLRTLQQIFRDNPEAGVVGPAITSVKGECQNPCKFTPVKKAFQGDYWSLLLPRVLRNKREKEWIPQAADGYYDFVNGAFFMMTKEKFVEAKGFDPRTFLFMEMPIMSMRLEQYGYKMYYTNKVSVLHDQRVTANPFGAPFRNLRADFQSKQILYVNYGHLPMAYVVGVYLPFEIFFSLFWIKKTFLNLLGIRE